MRYVNLLFLDLSAAIVFEAVHNEASNYENISAHFTYIFLRFFSSKLLLPQVFLLSSFNYRDQLTQSQETGKITYLSVLIFRYLYKWRNVNYFILFLATQSPSATSSNLFQNVDFICYHCFQILDILYISPFSVGKHPNLKKSVEYARICVFYIGILKFIH
jgi:hypothetical protein